MGTVSDDTLFEENLPNLCQQLSGKARKLCRPSTVTNKFPIIKWLPMYQTRFLLQDFIAGFTVGLTTIPQAIAYGVVAGLEPQYGLYSAFMGGFIYLFFGTCKDITIATTAIMALFVHQYAELSPDYSTLVAFLAGCIILLLGLLNIGVLVRFISIPVISGFMMAATFTIASAQINNLFGMSGPSDNFVAAVVFFFSNLQSIRLFDTLLGVSTLIFLFAFKYLQRISFGSKIMWKYISLSRNALAVILGAVLAFLLTVDGSTPFRITGVITPGLPPFTWPPFQTVVNGTVVYFPEMLQTIAPSLISVPLVATIEIVAISKAFAKGKTVDASQEMVALGMCNIMGSFVHSMPVTASFTRSAVNNASGVRTPLGGIVTGSLVLLALAFLTDYFYYIPKATLAAIIIAAMISLMDFKRVASMWHSKRLDIIPFVVTTLICLLWSLEYGILCGVAANLCYILYRSARPHIEFTKEKINEHEIGIADVKQRLDFASAEYLKDKIIRYVNYQMTEVRVFVIIGHEINSIDYTVAANIAALKTDLEVLNCDLICLNWNVSSAGVVCRLNNQLRNIFKFNMSLEDAVAEYFHQLPSSESCVTIVSNGTS